MSVIVCYATCWSCKFDHHFDPPREHRWAEADEIEAALAAGQPEPTGRCGCPCAVPTTDG